jgi:hypothetical protein
MPRPVITTRLIARMLPMIGSGLALSGFATPNTRSHYRLCLAASAHCNDRDHCFSLKKVRKIRT